MKAILRIQKLKTYAQIAGVHRHNERSKPTLNADPSSKNIRLHGNTALVDSIKELLSSYSIKPRKNAVLAAEYILTASPEAFTGSSKIDVEEWAQTNIQFLKNKHGAGLVSAWLHLDETTPHIHAVVVPLLKKENDQAKLCARDFFGGREKLSELQTQYAVAMGAFGLERGVEGSKARHKKVKQFYGELNVRTKKAAEYVRESLEENEEPSLLSYKKQHTELTKRLKCMAPVVAENEQLKTEAILLEQRVKRAETCLKHSRAECRSLKHILGNHSIEFVQKLIKWANSFLYDPDAPDLQREIKEESMTQLLCCDVRAKALTERWAHVVRRLARGEDAQELTLKK